MTTSKKVDDDLFKRLDRLNREAERGSKSADKVADDPYGDAATGIKQAYDGLRWFGGAIHKAGIVGKFLWNTIGSPVWAVAEPVLGGIGRFYKNRVWPYAYRTNEEGENVFSAKRAGVVLTATFAAAAMLLPASQLAYEGTLMATTMRHETVYMHTVNPHDDGSYSIKGCDNIDRCDIGDAVYVNVGDSWMRDAWSLANKGSLHVPRRLVATVAPDANNKCDITVYGAYYEKAMQNFNIFPNLLDISCVRVDNDGNPIGPKVTPETAAPLAVQEQAPVTAPAPAPAAPVYAPGGP